ncbi:Putative multidrug export ATP-binding/permease protein SAV1866 [Sarcina ventriculi]|uniref:ABC transporter ATP-binding protein n=1 Tax=Sarcina ventriculi TaxID=1267 RepID=UPI000D80761A|nr:ABC transporter ATP-binding protein [Sarcina ventriculi]SPZ49040.1 Putative multidrug export ATP-binding/permease protein SAV1866 [Sarcina ventriculi]
MLKIFKYLKSKEWLFVFFSVIFILVQVWLDLKLPDYMSEITTLVQLEGSTMEDILTSGGHMMLCAFGSLISCAIVAFFASKVAAAFSMRIRSKVFNKVESFSMDEINNFSTASLITRSTNDITQIQMFIAMGLQVIIKAPILAIWAIIKISDKNWQWTTTTAGAVIFLLVINIIIITFAIPKFKKIQGLTDNLNNITRENLTGLRVIRAYNAESYQEKKFENANNDLTSNNLFANRIMAIMNPSMGLVMNGLNLAVYWIGAYLIQRASMQDKLSLFSDMVVFSAYAVQVVMAFMMLTIIFIILPRATVCAKRINEVLDTKLSILDGQKDVSDISLRGEIEFKNVSFKYKDAKEYALKNISFTAHKGEIVAFIGSTGSGKSTLINLIPRLYDATSGEVLVDGINVKEYSKKDLNNKLGYVPQRAILFSGTVLSNVAYGIDETGDEILEKVKKSISVAQGTDFIENMKNTYNGNIAEGGTNVSGGQKQRLNIARAIYKNPEIYIFDDSFSALDYKTDRNLRLELKKQTVDATNIIVAQRIGTIKNADKIIVLDDGEIVGMGTHKELLKTCKVYREIAYSQLSKEELEDE